MYNLNIEQIKNQFLQRKLDIINARKLDDQEVDLKGDDIDAAQITMLAGIAKSLSHRDKIAISKIDAALSKISNGIYGYCEECDEDISEKRLLAIPDAELCINCAEKKEKEAKMYATYSR